MRNLSRALHRNHLYFVWVAIYFWFPINSKKGKTPRGLHRKQSSQVSIKIYTHSAWLTSLKIQMSDYNSSRWVIDSLLLFGTHNFFYQKITKNTLMVFWLDSSKFFYSVVVTWFIYWGRTTCQGKSQILY
jgi:hypothetical protein